MPGTAASGGIYPAQDRDDPEERAWLCLDAAAAPPVAVCTTHLAYTKREVAGAQCRYLFDTVIAQIRARAGAAPVVLGGDLNLGNGDSPDLKACLPSNSALVDDGGQQHVIATPEYVVDDYKTIDLRGTTDHPGLLVALTPATPADRGDASHSLSVRALPYERHAWRLLHAVAGLSRVERSPIVLVHPCRNFQPLDHGVHHLPSIRPAPKFFMLAKAPPPHLLDTRRQCHTMKAKLQP